MRPADTVRGRHLRRGGLRAVPALIALIGVAVLIAGCGGAAGLSVASIAGSEALGRPGALVLVQVKRRGRGQVPGRRAEPGAARPARGRRAPVLEMHAFAWRARTTPIRLRLPAAGPGSSSLGAAAIDPAAPLFRIAQRSCFSILTRRRGSLG